MQVQHCCQVQLAAAGADVRDVPHPSPIILGLLKLNRPSRWARRPVCQLSVMCKTCASTPAAARWRASGYDPISSQSHALLLQCCAQPEHAIGVAAGGKGGFQVNTVSTHHGCLTAACAPGVAAELACLKYPACLDHGYDLLLQLLHELVAHLISRAKKTRLF